MRLLLVKTKLVIVTFMIGATTGYNSERTQVGPTTLRASAVGLIKPTHRRRKPQARRCRAASSCLRMAIALFLTAASDMRCSWCTLKERVLRRVSVSEAVVGAVNRPPALGALSEPARLRAESNSKQASDSTLFLRFRDLLKTKMYRKTCTVD